MEQHSANRPETPLWVSYFDPAELELRQARLQVEAAGDPIHFDLLRQEQTHALRVYEDPFDDTKVQEWQTAREALAGYLGYKGYYHTKNLDQ